MERAREDSSLACMDMANRFAVDAVYLVWLEVNAKNIQNQAKYVNLRLDQANEYEIVEMFGKVVNTVRGVSHAKRFNQRIVSDNPQACVTEWEVEIDPNATDPFRLQANIMKMINDILDAGGTIKINGVPYRYTPLEMKLMMGIIPGNATMLSAAIDPKA